MDEDLPPEAPPPAMPLFGERALHLPEARAVVVGDVHVGLETELRQRGVMLPSQTMRMRERLERLLRETGSDRLVVIGDLKHRIPYSTRQEVLELPALFRDFPARVDLVRGNHDVDLDGLLDIDVHDAEGIRLGDVGLTHGHVWPSPDVMRGRVVVTCHNHPAVLMVDSLGHRHKEPCWIRAAFTDDARDRYPDLPQGARLVVMPAFNELTGGTAFNAEEGARLMGPLFTNGLVDVESARAYTLDGVDLGTLNGLKRYGADAPGTKRREARRGAKAARKSKGRID